MEQLLSQNQWVLLLIIAWILAWKGVALWMAARNGHKKWFIFILVLNTMGLLDIIYIFFFGRKKKLKDK